MITTAHTWNIKTTLLTATFTLCLLSTTALQILINPHSALAYSDTYPTSIAGCRYVSTGGSAGTCDLKDSTQDEYFDPWSEENRECTSYVAWMLHSINGFEMPFFDNAVNWKTKAQNLGYTVDMNPKQGSIYWSPNPTNVGHVAYVQSVSSDGTHVDTTDYNSDFTGHWNQELNVATSSAGGYIHFKDYNPPPPPPTVPTHRDLSWYDGTNLYGFQAYGYGSTTTQPGYSTPGWAGAGQYGSDSKEGIFWYDPNTTSIYYINSGFGSSQLVRGPGVGAPVWAGVGNFTGDGKRDSIAWYDGTNLWLFTGTGLASSAPISGYSTPAWAGVGDYNKDGKDDLFWYLSSSTTIYVLTSTGSTFNGAASVRGPGVGAPTWAGVGDFHGDGYRDALAWYSGGTLYTFEGSGLSTTGTVPGYSTPTWAGVGQWTSTTTKDGLYWYLTGSTPTLYGISSDGSKFTGATTLRSGIGAPTWADSGNFY